MVLTSNILIKKPIFINNNVNMLTNSTIYNPIIGSNLGIPLNILQYIFTTTYYHDNILNNELILLQFAIGIFTYGSDRLLDASCYLKKNEDSKIYFDEKINYYDFLIRRMNYNIFIIMLSYIYIFDLLKQNEKTYPFLFALTSTLFYRDFKKNFGELKALYIAIFWTLGCVILPCILHDNNYEILNYPNIYIPNFLLMFASSNILDIKDIEEDSFEGIKTLAVLFGENTTKFISNQCYILAGIIYSSNFI